jgi:hypothetical protein
VRRIALLVIVLSACSFGAAPLPTAAADIGSTHVSLQRGGYCWSTGSHATCADSADPQALLQTGYLKPVKVRAGATVKVSFSSEPSSVEVGLVGRTPVLANPFALTDEPGSYVYTITGYWHEGDVAFFLPVDVTR